MQLQSILSDFPCYPPVKHTYFLHIDNFMVTILIVIYSSYKIRLFSETLHIFVGREHGINPRPAAGHL